MKPTRSFSAWILATVTAALASSGVRAQPDFEMVRDLAPLPDVRLGVAGDFNGDGRTDLAVATTDRVLLFENDTADRLALRFQAVFGDSISSLETADLDGNGTLDLVAGLVDGSVGVRYGDGIGGFGPASHYAAGTSAERLTIGDANADGIADIVVADSEGRVVLLLGDGEGFSESARTHVGSDLQDIELAEVDEDPWPDLVYTLGGAGVTGVALAKGPGVWPSDILPWELSRQRIRSALADLDADGDLDLLVLAETLGEFGVYKNDGSGRFEFFLEQNTANWAERIAIADFDTDGFPDLVFAHPREEALSLHVGVGDGSFGPAVTQSLPGAESVIADDFDGDGVPDLAITRGGEVDRVTLLLGDGTGGFAEPATTLAGNDPRQGVAADFNGDGRLDLAGVDAAGIVVLAGDGRGDLAPLSSTPVGLAPLFVAAAAIDDDGALDLAVLCEGSRDVKILLGDGNGSFDVGSVLPLARITPFDELLLTDANEDGHIDLIVSQHERTLVDSGSVRVFLGAGDGTFVEGDPVLSSSMPGGLLAGDVDDDGRVDLIVGNRDPSSHLVLLGNGDGTFDGHRRYPTSAASRQIAAGDLDEDGIPDLVIGGRELVVLFGAPDGDFVPGPVAPAHGNFQQFPVITDFDGDGRLDIAAANGFGVGEIYLLTGDGTGGFPTLRTRTLPIEPDFLVAGDFTNDGLVDFASAGNTDTGIIVIAGTEAATSASARPTKPRPTRWPSRLRT